MIRDIQQKIKRQLNSRNGRNSLTFLVFLAISTLFWFLMSLNDEIQRDYELPVIIDGLPADITLLSAHGETPVVSISVRDKGANHLSRQFLKRKNLHIGFNDFNNSDNCRLTLSETQLNNIIRQQFGGTATVITQSPDSLSVSYTTLPPVKVPVIIKSNIVAKPQYTINGPIQTSADSVLIFSATPLSNRIKAVFTDIVNLDGISDTTHTRASINVPADCRAVPDTIDIIVPVEPLVSRTFTIPVEPLNTPDNTMMITFPTQVSFSCLVPMSLFNTAGYPVNAYADYDKRTGNTIRLELSLIPDNYINGTISPTSVEYILETE